MSTLTLERVAVARTTHKKTWLGKAIPWRRPVPPLRLRGVTLWPAHTKLVRTETVELTRENCGLDRQAHPQAVIGVGRSDGHRACSPRLARSIAKLARLENPRHVIVVVEGGDKPIIYYAPGNKLLLQLTSLSLDDVRYVPYSVIMARR